MLRFLVHLSRVSRFVDRSHEWVTDTDFLLQGDNFLLNVIDSLTDTTMLTSTSIVCHTT
jgi:hypothetical protein